MNKEQRSTVVEYASTLSEEDLRFLTQRMTDRLCGDLAEAINLMSTDQSMDVLLASAESAESFYNTLDQIRDVLAKECRKKGLNLKHSPAAA